MLYYLGNDQLGSASVSYRADGGNVVGQRYEPWGEVKGYETNQLPSDYSFTGQEDVNFTRAPNFYDPVRILDYGARNYWSAFGRFIPADTIIPSPGIPRHSIDTPTSSTIRCGIRIRPAWPRSTRAIQAHVQLRQYQRDHAADCEIGQPLL